MCKVYTGYCGTSEIEHGLCACTVDNPLAKALSPTCSMADGVSFDVSFSLNCTDLYKREGGALKPDSNFQIMDVRVRSVRSALGNDCSSSEGD